jgi:hypothetical protein
MRLGQRRNKDQQLLSLQVTAHPQKERATERRPATKPKAVSSKPVYIKLAPVGSKGSMMVVHMCIAYAMLPAEIICCFLHFYIPGY